MNHMRKFLSRGGAVLVGVALLLGAPSAKAQTTSASVSGTVNDPQGSGVPGATVTLTSLMQGNVANTTTDTSGRFTFAIVRPGTYSLRVSLQGFKTLERPNLVVNANDKLSTGAMTLQIGDISEEVSVLARVSELQAESGERSFTLESEAIKNIANNDRALFGFATLVPGVSVAMGVADNQPTQMSHIVVNGQRPNSNNMTIDGVANIDTGDNGGNMATTNIDAIAEFKVLTNSYQAEYGRAVGAQVQMVTKSGSQEFHGSGYWYGRRSDWNANTWTNKRNAAPAPLGGGQLIELPESSRNDFGYTLGGPIFIPGKFNTDKKKLFFFWSQEYQRRNDPVAERLVRVPTELERRGDFSQSVDNSGNPYPYIRDYSTGLPCSASDTRGCFQDGGVLGRVPQNRIYQPGLASLGIYPLPNTSAGSGLNYTSQTPGNVPRREHLIRLDFQPSDSWHLTSRYMRNSHNEDQPYGTTWAGAGGNVDNIQTTRRLPGENVMLSAQGILNTTTSLELSVGRGHNELEYAVGNPDLTRTAAGLSGMPLLYPDAVQSDYIPDFNFAGGRTTGAGRIQTDRGPFTNVNTTWDVLANLTKIMGKHSTKAGVYFQHSYKPQSPFASFNGLINFTDSSSNPYDTGLGYANAATGVFNTYTQASKYALPEWVYKNIEWYAQDNWKATSRLTLDYGVRFYYMTPQWDQTLAASTFLPSEYNAANAASLYTPVCVGGSYPCSGSDLRAMDPALIGVQTPTISNTVVSRFAGRLVPGSERFNGAFQAGQGISDTMQGGNAFRISPRFGFVYDLSGKGTTILRGGGGIFYDRPQGNMVFNQITNAPGILQPQLQWGRLQDLASAGGDPYPTLTMAPTAYDFEPPVTYAWNAGIQHKLWKSVTFDLAYVGSASTESPRAGPDQLGSPGCGIPGAEPEPTLAPSSSRAPMPCCGPHATVQRVRQRSRLMGLHGRVQLPLAADVPQRRFDNGFMFSTFYVWSKTLTTTDTDFSARHPNSTDPRRIVASTTRTPTTTVRTTS